jgi:chaperonin GroEL
VLCPFPLQLTAGGNSEIGQLIADAMAKVGRQGVVTMEESKTAEDNLVFVEGMQVSKFDQHLTSV